MSKQHEVKLQSGYTYHLIFRGNNSENIFLENKNYNYFLLKYWERMSPLFNTFAFCQMGNHAHFLIQVKPYLELHHAQPFYFSRPLKATVADDIEIEEQEEYDEKISLNLSKQIGKWLAGYTKAINIGYDRKGKLFNTPFDRIKVEDERYFEYLLCYIHRNPLHHGFCENWNDWKYTSYRFLLESFDDEKFQQIMPSKFETKEPFTFCPEMLLDYTFIKNWFDSKENYLLAHELSLEGMIRDFLLE